jgi:hypothetical protein
MLLLDLRERATTSSAITFKRALPHQQLVILRKRSMIKCLLLISFLAQVCISSASEAKPDDFGILEWVHNAEGGFYNPKQDFRYETPGDPTSVAGIFANERIEKGETLSKVPWQRLLKSDDSTENDGKLSCGTGRAVAREMRKAENSDYAPYVTYLNAQSEGQLPSAWSKKGKALLQEIIGGTPLAPVLPPIEPTERVDTDWYTRCSGDPSNKLATKAALLVAQRSDDGLMIPAYDFYNHRNGMWLNIQTETVQGTHHITKANRTIVLPLDRIQSRSCWHMPPLDSNGSFW